MSQLSADLLANLLRRQLELTSELTSLLRQERAHISQNQLEAFEHAVEQKTHTIHQLADVDHQVNAIIAASAFAGQRLPVIITQLGKGSQDLHGLWQQLLEAVALCSQENTINTQVVSACLQQGKAALNILTGRLPNETRLYGASGQTIEHTQSSTHIKA